MIMTFQRFFFLNLLFFIVLLISCNSDTYNNSPYYELKFDRDTLYFDTVFQSLGSATRAFKIYNRSEGIIVLDEIYLEKNSQSKYRFNIDGASGPIAKNISIRPGDSIWCFVDVKIDPQNESLIVEDHIVFSFNTKQQRFTLRAFGQNAYYHYGEIISSSVSWQNDKPHIIIDKHFGNSIVPGIYVKSGATLTILPGCKLFFSNNAGILVGGTLKVLGDKNQKVEMGGLRLEQKYQNLAGQWLGLLFLRNTKDNVIKYTTIDESIFGVWLGFQDKTDFNAMNDATRAEIRILNSTIKNAYYWAIRSLNNKIVAENSQFFTSTDYLVQLVLGGIYEFTNCTFYNSQSSENKGVLWLSNRIFDNSSKKFYSNGLQSAQFSNCIFYGNASEQLDLDFDSTVLGSKNYIFNNCLYGSRSNFTNSFFKDCILNENPLFVSTAIDKENFDLNINSPCINNGIFNNLNEDLLGRPRNVGGALDIGAFEKQ